MKRILVVEDNEQNMYLCAFLLKAHGYEVIEAINGEKGVELAIQESPDLVLMDIQLPDFDGMEATRRIRQLEIKKGLPIVALTSYAMPGDREKALEAGCTGYIEKPINPDTFINEIKIHLNTPDNQEISTT